MDYLTAATFNGNSDHPGLRPKRHDLPILMTDRRWLAVTSARQIELWEVATGRQGRTIEYPGGSLRFHSTDAVFKDAVFTPDSRYIVSVDENDLRLWDTFTGRDVRKWLADDFRHVAFSPENAHAFFTPIAGLPTVQTRLRIGSSCEGWLRWAS